MFNTASLEALNQKYPIDNAEKAVSLPLSNQIATLFLALAVGVGVACASYFLLHMPIGVAITAGIVSSALVILVSLVAHRHFHQTVPSKQEDSFSQEDGSPSNGLPKVTFDAVENALLVGEDQEVHEAPQPKELLMDKEDQGVQRPQSHQLSVTPNASPALEELPQGPREWRVDTSYTAILNEQYEAGHGIKMYESANTQSAFERRAIQDRQFTLLTTTEEIFFQTKVKDLKAFGQRNYSPIILHAVEQRFDYIAGQSREPSEESKTQKQEVEEMSLGDIFANKINLTKELAAKIQ